MRIKKLYLLLIFLFSILLTNLHISNIKPSLTYEKTPNIVTLVDNVKGSNLNLINLEPSEYNKSFITSDLDRDTHPLILLSTTLLIVTVFKIKEVKFKRRELKGLDGIVLWDRKRVLRN